MALPMSMFSTSSSSVPSRAGNPSDVPLDATVLKWTNAIEGWQRRWVAIDGSLVFYTRPLGWSEKKRFQNGPSAQLGSDGCLRVHGGPGPSLKVFFAKVTGYRASRSNARKFVINTARKSVELKASTEQERDVWMNALAQSTDGSHSRRVTFKSLRAHLFTMGLTVGLIRDCEFIILQEVADILQQQSGCETEGAGQEIARNEGGTELQAGLSASQPVEISNSTVTALNPTEIRVSFRDMRILLLSEGLTVGFVRECEQIIMREIRNSVQQASPISFREMRTHLFVNGLTVGVIRECEQIVLREVTNFTKQVGVNNEILQASGQQVQQNGEISKRIEKGREFPSGRAHEPQVAGLIIGEPSHAIGPGNSTILHGNPAPAEPLEEDEEPVFFDATDFLSVAPQEPVSEFYDTSDVFPDPADNTVLIGSTGETGRGGQSSKSVPAGQSMPDDQSARANEIMPSVRRRSELPEPREMVKEVSLWSVMKDSVGKDLKNINLPITFHEPLSSLQKWCQEFEYSYLLDEAYEAGKAGNGLMRAMKVAAFAVASYASYDGRSTKPFNPLLGETYEADFPEKGFRFIVEKVSRHPLTIACHCEGRGWKFWGDNTLRSKFRGSSIQLDPIGDLFVEFNDGEIFTWAKVNSSINNLVLGNPYCNHNGTMTIKGNRYFSSWLKFKESSLLDRMPRKVHGFVTDLSGNEVATLKGEWNNSFYCETSKPKVQKEGPSVGELLLWKKHVSPADLNRYKFSSFGVVLNEITPDLEENLPPTDSRLRPDQRSLENGEFTRATVEKHKLEEKKNMVGDIEENAWKPKWFHRDESGTYRYVGGYWEAKEGRDWGGCPNIFG